MKRAALAGALAFAAAGCQLLVGIDPDVQVVASLDSSPVDGAPARDASALDGGSPEANPPSDGPGDEVGDGGNASDAGSTYWIYINGDAAWSDKGSFSATADDQDQSAAPGGEQYDVRVVVSAPFGAWAAKPVGPSVGAARYKKLTFELQPTKPLQTWDCYVSDGTDLTKVAVGPYSSASPMSGEWSTYTIPFSALGLKAADSITMVVIQDETGASSNVWYLDNVGLVP